MRTTDSKPVARQYNVGGLIKNIRCWTKAHSIATAQNVQSAEIELMLRLMRLLRLGRGLYVNRSEISGDRRSAGGCPAKHGNTD